MKKLFKSFLLAASIAGLITLIIGFMTSCQNEDIQVNTNNNSFTNKSQLVDLLNRVSKNSTSVDNVIDSTSCFKVNLPVTVLINGKEVVITDESDYGLVKNIFNKSDDDEDDVSFIFPITISFSDYSTTLVTNDDQMKDIINNCGKENNEVEINCISINYPITVSEYNTITQTPSTVVINDDSQLYNFFEDVDDDYLDEDDFYEIIYPISVTNAQGSQIIIKNNGELQNAIDDAIGDCEGSGEIGESTALASVLVEGTWQISYFFHETDKSVYFSGYNFVFSANGLVNATLSKVNLSGEWESHMDLDEKMLKIEFENSQLTDLSADWEVIEYSQTQIRLKYVSGEDGETDYLTFTKN